MARIASVLAGLALALCLAFPAAAVPPDRMIFDSGGIGVELTAIDLVAAPADFDIVAIDPAVDLPVPIVATNCANGPAWIAVETVDGLKAERLPPCTTGRYDPGWRAG